MSGGSGLSCCDCLLRLCVTKDDSGRVTGLSFRDDAGGLAAVPDCGSGSGGGGGVTTGCCARTIPATLYLTFTISDLCCFEQGATVPLAYDAANGWWEYAGYEGGTCEGFPSRFVVYCCGSDRDVPADDACIDPGAGAGDWRLFWQCAEQGNITTPSGEPGSTCDPLSLRFDPQGPALSVCCGALGLLRITVTESPP